MKTSREMIRLKTVEVMTAVRMPLADPVRVSCPVVLCNEDGEGISEILHRQVGECVDLYCCGESGP